jgi:molecular chaperone DnaK
MDYGIETVGGRFSTIIPKGSSFPTPEPIIRRFSTPTANLTRIKVPIYAGFNELASQNELQATVWLELPEQVPARAPLEVAFSLDADGILQRVKVSLKDGSGSEVDTFLDRFQDTKRSRLEKKLEQLRLRREEVHRDLDPSIDREMEVAYAEATRALTKNDPDTAERHAQEMEGQLRKVSASTGPQWKQKAEGLIGYSEFILSEFAWLLDPAKTMEIKGLVESLRAAVTRDDEAAAEAKWQALDKATDDLPPIVQMLMALVNGIVRAIQRHDEVRADKIKAAKQEIELAIRRGSAEEVGAKFAAIEPVLKEVFGEAPMSGKTRISEALAQE